MEFVWLTHLSHPLRHFVGARLAVVDVEDDDGDDDRQTDHHHGEEEIFSQQRQRQWRRRNDLGDEQEEHGLRQQDGNAQGHLLARVGWQVEDQHR